MMFDDLERWSKIGILGVDTQVYDLTAATEFVFEIADANSKANAPLFASGLPVAKAFVLILNVREKPTCIMVRRVSDTHVECELMVSIEARQARKSLEDGRAKLNRLRGDLDKAISSAPKWAVGLVGAAPKVPTIGTITNDDTDDDVAALVEIGLPCELNQEWQPAVLHVCSAACEFMAMPIATKQAAQMPRAARRRMERDGRGVSLVDVGIARSVAAGYAQRRSDDHGRALHFVSGHWRISQTSAHRKWVFGDWRIWIDGHWRGDPAHGVILHRYVAKQREERLIGDAA